MIREVGRDKVSAVVTDNAAPMKAMWSMIVAAFPGVVCLGCVAHSINLLLLDIFKLQVQKMC